MSIAKFGKKCGKELGKTLAICAVLAAAFLTVSASAESKARIVRLSEVEGTVQLDRATGDGFDKAFINLPVIEGCKLKTGKDGRAEVEFEDGSALRLAPDTEVDFTHLALGDDGQKLSAAQLVSGTVYAHLHPKTYG
ncbi:MAG: FecR domain-containing protein, partial [Terriglobales bacterium]